MDESPFHRQFWFLPNGKIEGRKQARARLGPHISDRIRSSMRERYRTQTESDRDQHSFRLKHWLCVTQLLLLWIRPVYRSYTCVVCRRCHVNHNPEAMNRKENWVYLMFTQHIHWKLAKSKPNFKIFVQTQSDHLVTSRYHQAQFSYPPSRPNNVQLKASLKKLQGGKTFFFFFYRCRD